MSNIIARREKNVHRHIRLCFSLIESVLVAVSIPYDKCGVAQFSFLLPTQAGYFYYLTLSLRQLGLRTSSKKGTRRAVYNIVGEGTG